MTTDQQHVAPSCFAFGGADAPFEIIYEYVGARMPGGGYNAQGTPDARQHTWLQMRAWCCISYGWLLLSLIQSGSLIMELPYCFCFCCL